MRDVAWAPRSHVSSYHDREPASSLLPAAPAARQSVIFTWICEILSPGNTSNDTVINNRGAAAALAIRMRAYHQAQVGHYWLLDPIGKTLAVYRWTAPGYLFVLRAEHTERVRAEPFGDLDLSVGAHFGDEDEE